jgi:hypothetical protein
MGNKLLKVEDTHGIRMLVTVRKTGITGLLDKPFNDISSEIYAVELNDPVSSRVNTKYHLTIVVYQGLTNNNPVPAFVWSVSEEWFLYF